MMKLFFKGFIEIFTTIIKILALVFIGFVGFYTVLYLIMFLEFWAIPLFVVTASVIGGIARMRKSQNEIKEEEEYIQERGRRIDEYRQLIDGVNDPDLKQMYLINIAELEDDIKHSRKRIEKIKKTGEAF